MSLGTDLRTVYHLLFTRGRGADAAERLENFYGPQAQNYDDFRKRLLHGRETMMQSLEIPQGAHLADLGGGTGSNLEALGDHWGRIAKATVVDLCPALLRVAEERIARKGWTNARAIHADVTTYEPDDGPLDIITFSYSLTMIPDWFRALDRAYTLLKPGGMLGVVDFHISKKWPASGLKRHSAFQRSFWPWWFAHDNVFLTSDLLPYLRYRFDTVRLEEQTGRVPFMPFLRVPYLIFLGRKAMS